MRWYRALLPCRATPLLRSLFPFLCIHTRRVHLTGDTGTGHQRELQPMPTLRRKHRHRPRTYATGPVHEAERDTLAHRSTALSHHSRVHGGSSSSASRLFTRTAIAAEPTSSSVAVQRPSSKNCVVHPAYVGTLTKRVSPRHTGRHGAVLGKPSVSAFLTDTQRRDAMELEKQESALAAQNGYDPATVVRVESEHRQLHLNPIQREMIWTARQQQYHQLLLRIVACLQSHRTPLEKCQTLTALHDEVVIPHRLRLRADTYEDIFHVFYAVGVRRGGGAGRQEKAVGNEAAQLPAGDAQWDHEMAEGATRADCASVPHELSSSIAAATTVVSPHGIDQLWSMYRYMIDSGTNPTTRIVQYMMGLLEHACFTHAGGQRGSRSTRLLTEAKAHSLLMDLDRFHLEPSEYTINSYIGVCDACNVMHLAVSRFMDYQTRQERQATPGMYARLLTALVRRGHTEEAMSTVTTMQNVAMTTYLLNAVLQAARSSSNPMSCFSFYRALFLSKSTHKRRGQRAPLSPHLSPSLPTFSILLEVILAEECFEEIDFIISEMRYYGIKANGLVLNKFLIAMRAAGRSNEEMSALREAMRRKGVAIFDESRGSPTPSLHP